MLIYVCLCYSWRVVTGQGAANHCGIYRHQPHRIDHRVRTRRTISPRTKSHGASLQQAVAQEVRGVTVMVEIIMRMVV